jgi:hypothetical protein
MTEHSLGFRFGSTAARAWCERCMEEVPVEVVEVDGGRVLRAPDGAPWDHVCAQPAVAPPVSDRQA